MNTYGKIHRQRFHLALFLLPLLLLVACDRTPEMPLSMRQSITGDWKQVNGSASLRFYTDATVMVRLSNRNPPLSFLASYDLMKDRRISISTGDVWQGPIICTREKGSKTMQVTIPDQADIVLEFIKQ